MKKVLLDGKLMTTKYKLHEELRNKLGLPEFYGDNLDALWDMITGYLEIPFTIIFINFKECRKNLGHYADDLLLVFNRAENEIEGFKIFVKSELRRAKSKRCSLRVTNMNTLNFCRRYFVERKGTYSSKWDDLKKLFGRDDLISMWVADMDFKAPEAVGDALRERVDHGVYGYSLVSESFYESVINWEDKQHGYKINREWIRLSQGVVPSIYWFVNAYTKPGESVIILTPVYYPFHNAVKDTGRNLIMCELINENGYYTIDFEKFEKNIIENEVKMFIHSSPHNPVGRVWSEEELNRLLKICKDSNVLVVSDEIHQDIVLSGYKHIPAATVKNGGYANNLITITAASKTFNLAGLSTSYMVIENPEIRKIYDDYVSSIALRGVNLMGLIATRAAYNGGRKWLSSLIKVLAENYDIIVKSFSRHLPKVVISPLEGTYLVWIDLRAYVDKKDVKEFILNKCRIAVDFGEWFSPLYQGFIRLNIATNPKYVKFAVKNIIDNLT